MGLRFRVEGLGFGVEVLEFRGIMVIFNRLASTSLHSGMLHAECFVKLARSSSMQSPFLEIQRIWYSRAMVPNMSIHVSTWYVFCSPQTDS